MGTFLLGRLAQVLLTMLAASFLLFAVTEFSPGSVARKVLGPYAVDSQVAILSSKLGLEDPLLVRYGRWLGTLSGAIANPITQTGLGLGYSDPRGDRYAANFGISLMHKKPVVDVVASRIGNTALLALWAVGLTVPIALLLGTVAGMRAGSFADRGVTAVTVTLTSLPEFVTGVVLILVFTVWLGWLPGTSPLDPGDRWSVGAQLVMPVAVLVIASAAYVTRIVRASVAEIMKRPYVRTARLKGLSPRRVVLDHVLRNAMIAPVTVILLQVNWILTGVVVVESIFAYPGLGKLMLDAALFGDIYLIQALTLLALAVATLTQFLGDLIYVAIDPRIRVA